jgi:hypothetical protein
MATKNELIKENEAAAKEGSKASAVRWALLSLGYPNTVAGKAEIEDFFKKKKYKKAKFTNNQISIYRNQQTSKLDKDLGITTASKPKKTSKPANKASYDNAVKELAAELYGDKIKLALQLTDGDKDKAKTVLATL